MNREAKRRFLRSMPPDQRKAYEQILRAMPGGDPAPEAGDDDPKKVVKPREHGRSTYQPPIALRDTDAGSGPGGAEEEL